MISYITGLSYEEACEAKKLIENFAKKQTENKKLTTSKRSMWKDVSAKFSAGGLAVTTEKIMQVQELNVMLSDNDCGYISQNEPFIQRSPAEKEKTLMGSTNQHLVDSNIEENNVN